MRIAIFSESYEPIVNGVTVCVRTLRDELLGQGHEVFVFAPAFDGFIDTYDRVFRLPSRRTRFAPDYPIPVPYSPAIREAFRELKPEIVHTQTPFLLGLLGARWARRDGIPVVSTNHTLYTEYAHYAPFLPKGLTAWGLTLLMRRYYNSCDGVITPSSLARDVLRSYGVKSRIEVIASGVEVGTSADGGAKFREDLGIPLDARVLLYVGRLAREKNLDMLLSAFALIREERPDTRMILVGGGPYEGHLRTEAKRLGLNDSVISTGCMTKTELASIYPAAQVFVWPSITETQGLAACEALSAGLPCVAVNGGGTPECLEDGGDSLLTPNDAVEFAERVLRLLNDDNLRARMSAKALANSARFSTAEAAASFVEFYESIIEGR